MAAYYVSPSGSDDDPGTLSEPWRTVAKAFASAVSGDTIYFRDGDYYVHDSGYARLGVDGVTFAAYQNEHPIWYGGIPLTWTKVDSYWKATVPEHAGSSWNADGTPDWNRGSYTVFRKGRGWAASPIRRIATLSAGDQFAEPSVYLGLTVLGVFEADGWYLGGSRFIRRHHGSAEPSCYLERNAAGTEWRLYVRNAAGTLVTESYWRRAGGGEDPPEGDYEPVGNYQGTVVLSGVEPIEDGEGNTALPAVFENPPSNESQGSTGALFWTDDGKLLFDLCYFDDKNREVWFRPAGVAPMITDPDAELLVSTRPVLSMQEGKGSETSVLGIELRAGIFGVEFSTGCANAVLGDARIYGAMRQGIYGSSLNGVVIDDCVIDCVSGWVVRHPTEGDEYRVGFGYQHGCYTDGDVSLLGCVISRCLGGAAIVLGEGQGAVEGCVVIGSITGPNSTAAVNGALRNSHLLLARGYRYSFDEPVRNNPMSRLLYPRKCPAFVIEGNYLEVAATESGSCRAIQEDVGVGTLNVTLIDNVLRAGPGTSGVYLLHSIVSSHFVGCNRNTWMMDGTGCAWQLDSTAYNSYESFASAWSSAGNGSGDSVQSSSVSFDATAFSRYMDTHPTAAKARAYIAGYVGRVLGRRKGCLLSLFGGLA